MFCVFGKLFLFDAKSGSPALGNSLFDQCDQVGQRFGRAEQNMLLPVKFNPEFIRRYQSNVVCLYFFLVSKETDY